MRPAYERFLIEGNRCEERVAGDTKGNDTADRGYCYLVRCMVLSIACERPCTGDPVSVRYRRVDDTVLRMGPGQGTWGYWTPYLFTRSFRANGGVLVLSELTPRAPTTDCRFY